MFQLRPNTHMLPKAPTFLPLCGHEWADVEWIKPHGVTLMTPAQYTGPLSWAEVRENAS